jgi:large subunit ribosomal protein L15
MRPGFEGGQLPLIKRLPKKRGFFNLFRTEYSVVNVAQLNVFEPGSEITLEALRAAGVVRTSRQPVKVLAGGEIDRALKVKAQKFSAAARAKIEAAGGTTEEVGYVATEVD